MSLRGKIEKEKKMRERWKLCEIKEESNKGVVEVFCDFNKEREELKCTGKKKETKLDVILNRSIKR